jgi:enoyl-CoA hydratase/carnithine racemase
MTEARCRYRRTGDVGTIHLSWPRTGNAVDVPMTRDLLAGIEQARANPPRLLVLASTSKVFCAGLNLPAIQDGGSTALGAALRGLTDVFDALHRLPFPTLSLVDGAAVGAGADLAASTDLRVGTERARFAFPGLGFGLLFGTSRLRHLVGSDGVHRLVLLGERLDARQALDWGLLTDATTDAAGATDVVTRTAERLSRLTPESVASLLSVTRAPTASQDRALLEDSLAQPYLFDRFVEFATERGFGRASQGRAVTSGATRGAP